MINTRTRRQRIGEVIYLTNDRGVTKKLIDEGMQGPDIQTGDEVSFHFTGRRSDGTIFDTSEDREALNAFIGVEEEI